MAVSKKYIEELIQEREYEELKELLEQFFQDEKNKNNEDYRLFFNILRIIKQMQVISEAKYYVEPKVDYEYDENYGIKRFYEALKGKDYEEAYRLTFDCIQYLTKKNKSTYDFYLYQLVLEDVVYLQREKIELTKIKTLINNDISSLRQISLENKDFNVTLIPELKNIIENIVDKSYECDMDCMQFIYMLEVISMIEQVNNYKYIDKSYFCNLNKEFEYKPDFYEKLCCGDYIRSYEYLLKRENREELVNNSPALNIKILFKLIKLLNNLIDMNSKNHFASKTVEEKISDLLVFDETEKAIATYLNSSIPKNEEVLSKLLIMDKYNNMR